MIHLLKRLLPREPLPPHVHFHLDGDGNERMCDASACRPAPRVHPLLLLPPR